MNMLDQIKEEKQMIARCEKSLALEKLKKRRAGTRRKIELGGLVIKSTLDVYSKSIILGSLEHCQKLINQDNNYLKIFEAIGMKSFLK